MGGAASFVGGLVGGSNSPLNIMTGRSAQKYQQQAANYSQLAAQEQLQEARNVRGQLERWGQQSLNEARSLSQMSPQELRAMEGQLGAAERQLANDERLLSAVDPALMEASQQALKLLRGEKADSLGPLEAQRKEQRQQLIQSLREQYGPGAETSSLGAKALRQFDSETANITNAAQQQSLGSLLGVAQGSRPNLSNNVAALGSAAGSFGNVANRQTQANLTAYGNLMSSYAGASQSVIGGSGAQYTAGVLGNQAAAQRSQNMSNQLWNLAGVGLGGMLGGAGKATPGAMNYGGANINPLAERTA